MFVRPRPHPPRLYEPRPPNPPHQPDVVVIGGGFAGLAAATALVEAGARVHVVEARPHLGGRATAFRDPVTAERIDNGQHVIAGCYRETLTFLNRIGMAGHLHRPSTLRVPFVDERGHTSVLSLPPLTPPLDLAAGVLAWDAIDFADRLSVLRIGPVLTGKSVPSGELTVRQWLESEGQSRDLCRMLWEPLALAALNQSIDAASAVSFVAVVSRMFGAEPDASALLFPSVPLDDLYAHPAARFLRDAGSTVTTSAPARLELTNGRVSGVRIREQLLAARRVVSAVPWVPLGDLFETPPLAAESMVQRAAGMESSPIVTVNLWMDRTVLDEPFVGLPGRAFQWIFDRRRLIGASETHLSCVSSGAEAICAQSNQDLIARALSEVCAALPRAARATLTHGSVVRERRATFSLAPGGPPRPGPVTPVDGLLLAGDWTDTGLPATIESAVMSGHAAARAALRALA